MDKIRRLYLSTFASVINDEKEKRTEEMTEEEWAEFEIFARKQKGFLIILPEMLSRGVPAFENNGQKLRELYIEEIAMAMAREEAFSRLYGRLTDEGFHVLVVKGAVCRSLYPVPAARISSDEDLLVPEEEFAAIGRYLLDNGFAYSHPGQDPEGEERGYLDQKTHLYLELHRRMFPKGEKTLARFQDEAVFPRNGVEATFDHSDIRFYGEEGKGFYSLAPLPYLKYLINHAYKHFIGGGFGLRQLADICLWRRRYADEIDDRALYQRCAGTGILTFASAVFAIGEEDLGIKGPSSPEWRDVRADRQMLLEDILNDSLYGRRDDFIHQTSGMMDEIAAGRGRTAVVRELLPSYKKMKARYPVLRKAPILLPGAWIVRIGTFATQQIKGKHFTAGRSIREARRREKVLKAYDAVERKGRSRKE